MKGHANAAGLIQFFAGAFDFKSASTEDLEFLSMASEYVECNALSLAETVNGVAYLIHADCDESRGISAGAFQGRSVTDFLYLVSDCVQMIGKLSYVAGEADYQLRERAKGGSK